MGGQDGWITTSDLAHIDSDGFLYIEGRADDVILRGGFKIAPETVIRALRSHPTVADAAVAGLPDDRWARSPSPQWNCATASWSAVKNFARIVDRG